MKPLVHDMVRTVFVTGTSLHGEPPVEPAGCGGQAGLLQAGHVPPPTQVTHFHSVRIPCTCTFTCPAGWFGDGKNANLGLKDKI
jgi:hypothetical protein